MTTAQTASILNAPLLLPCGTTLPNRLAKAAMTEMVADSRNRATDAHVQIYRAWARSGPGLMLTGNVQVDYHNLEHPGNVVIQGKQDAEQLAALRRWSAAAKEHGNHIWMQIAHAGRQTNRFVNPTPKAPSAIPLAIPGVRFGTPVALTHDEIVELIGRFADAAAVARETGFDGVQLHAAHGYLFSQFLSPRSNIRDDEWGGDLASRARFLLESVKAIRSKVGADFPIGIKLNSADFQRGGFSFEDSQIVATWLDEACVDLIEISGGTYEQPSMTNAAGGEPGHDPYASKASRDRESYFGRFGPEMRRHLKRARLMVTGGLRTARGMADAIANDGFDLIGLARPLCLEPDASAALLRGDPIDLVQPTLRIGSGWLGPKSPIKLIRTITGAGSATWYNEQILRLSAGRRPDRNLNFAGAFIRSQLRERRMAKVLDT
ncbi:NADH:flavin oxidoreductase/NADH oxidase family protein [Lysobacter cavernae]|uniref:NADH:flavin oxidoreductase/NADH oxidase family protein n=1 Tax=Lysobacter cavernae TaxID=1685901 RepID=A0ABV7RRM9_9GAMM